MTARYPDWICHACGTTLSRGHHLLVSTYHLGRCGWCGEQRAVTQPRDYGWPAHPAEELDGDTSCQIRWKER